MGATVVLQETDIAVVPGEERRVRAVVTNTGTLVDAVVLDVVGLPEGWGRVEPPEVRLLPGRRADVHLVVRPPRASTTTTGQQVLGVRGRPREDPGGAFVDEAVLDVLPYDDVEAELVPRSRTTRGLRRRRFVVAVDNRGNAPVTVELDAVDPDQHLLLAVRTSELHCEPGTANFGTLLVRPHRRHWRGSALSRGFVAQVRVPGQREPLELPGSLTQAALLPQSLPRLALRTALLGAGLLALLLLVLPRLDGTEAREAREAAEASAEQAIAPVADTAAQAAADADAARRAAEEAAARLAALPLAPPSGEPVATPTGPPPEPSPAPPPPAVDGGVDSRPQPFAARLQVSEGATAPFLRIAEDRELSLEGFVLQPNGDRGEMSLLRDGEALVTARLGDTQVFDLPAPLRFGPASVVQFSVVCRNPAGEACDAAVLLTGTARGLVPATPPPSPGAVAPAPAPQPQPRRTAEPLPAASG